MAEQGRTSRIAVILCLLVSVGLPLATTSILEPPVPAHAGIRLAHAAFLSAPLAFEPNRGQVDSQVRYLARAAGYTVYLTDTSIVLGLQSGLASPCGTGRPAGRGCRADETGSASITPLVLHFMGGSRHPRMAGLAPLPAHANYFLGDDPGRWHTDIPTFGRVMVRGVYPGVDLLLHGASRNLEYDWIAHPEAHISAIRMTVEGGIAAAEPGGTLRIRTAVGDVRLSLPQVYQETPRGRRTVHSAYRVQAHHLAFAISGSVPGRTVVVDPVLSYSAVVGGSAVDESLGVAVDTQGSAYIAGDTSSIDFPLAHPVQARHHTSIDAFVAKLNPSGTGLEYSTYLGGSGGESARAIKVEASNNVTIAGETDSTNFPTAHALQPANRSDCGEPVSGQSGCRDAFVARLTSEGNALIFSTYLGAKGNDEAIALALDSHGAIYVTGQTDSTDFPTEHPFQASGSCDLGATCAHAFVTKLNASASKIVYSTYLGGTGNDEGQGIAVDAAGSAYVTGWTDSDNFPLERPLQTTLHGQYDAFVTRLKPSGDALVYSTYLGGGADEIGSNITVDSAGNAYATGWTSSRNFPTAHALQPQYGGGESDAYLSVINSAGSPYLTSTYLGGSGADEGFSVAVDRQGAIHLTGLTGSSNFPTRVPVQAIRGGKTDAFVARLAPGGRQLMFSTYLGGSDDDNGEDIAVDRAGNIYVTGSTLSQNFPVVRASFHHPGVRQAFVVRINERSPKKGHSSNRAR